MKKLTSLLTIAFLFIKESVMKRSFIIALVFLAFLFSGSSGQMHYLKSIKKIDFHAHAQDDAEHLREIMDELNMKMLIICHIGGFYYESEGVEYVKSEREGPEGFRERMDIMHNVAEELYNKYPRYYSWSAVFDLTRRNEPNYTEDVKMSLKEKFDSGVLAVKVWKEIGMVIKNSKGEFIQIDDPMFDPILDFIEKEGKTLIAHIGDPVSGWMPGKAKPVWYSWKRPDKPSYSEIMAARDNMLEKHPNLKVIGCHFGSLDWDVDQVAKRLDKYPNFAVDTAGKIRSLMAQHRTKVRNFLIKYQDRIIWGSDISGGETLGSYFLDMIKFKQKMTPVQIKERKQRLIQKYLDEFEFYATDNEINVGDYTVNGLALPKVVLRKIFYENAVKWVPGVDELY